MKHNILYKFTAGFSLLFLAACSKPKTCEERAAEMADPIKEAQKYSAAYAQFCIIDKQKAAPTHAP
ncbi:MAG: hypothetical protein DI551_11355 [Micavibrio aeruginosavorus]|uniref:Lipoprotein n=1 Tax=Micavibrio aeruginosavorus TaxID=349221 RepID=A0A2W5PMQ7_9BACT|nr:MAG: hypothetical protein DI551_11355 [Micavibrio aeruginosavorus]